MEKDIGGGVVRDDTLFVMEMQVIEAYLDHPLVGVGLSVLARSQEEEESDLY